MKESRAEKWVREATTPPAPTVMDAEDATPKKKARRKPKPAPRLGDVKMTKVAIDTLRVIEAGGHISAIRTYPQDFHFQLHDSPKAEKPKPPATITDALVDTLVRTQCIATDKPTADTRVYRLTDRGRAALRGEGLDPVEPQAEMFEMG